MKEEVFWSKVNKTAGCWLWTSHQRAGYGVFPERNPENKKTRTISAHRRAWELVNGKIPSGSILCHKCDVRLCVNPDHLFIGSPKDNMEDMKQKDRGRALLTNDQVIHLRQAALNNENLYKYVEEYHISVQCISNAVRGNSHNHINNPPPVLGKLNFDRVRPGSVLTQNQVFEILDSLKKPYHGQRQDLARKYKVGRNTIYEISKGLSYGHYWRVYHNK